MPDQQEQDLKSRKFYWKSIQDAFIKETENRLSIDVTKLCGYGIKPLDAALTCIGKNELIVIGADSGVGKTELALTIASYNAKKGKRVCLYSLEGGYLEAISRIKWRDITNLYYSDEKYYGLGIDMNYKKWALNMLNHPVLTEIHNSIWEKYKESYKNNLFIYSQNTGLNFEDFFASIIEFHKLENIFTSTGFFDLDLIIIDHLQYFTLTQKENEISEMTNILKEVKKITEMYKIPVILISHLRKKNKDRGIPDQEDFYGTSNIPKISNTSIVIASATDKDNLSKNVFPTYFRVVKSRVGIRPNYAMLVDFDLNTRSYKENYEIYKLDSYGNVKEEPLSTEELPKWAIYIEKTSKE